MVTTLRIGTTIAIVATGLIAVNVTPAAAAPSWSIVSSPSPAGPTHGELDGLACTSNTNCLAVGNNYAGLTLGERWNGSSWSQVRTPDPSWLYGNGPSYLSDIACIKASNCFAVGFGIPGAFGPQIQRWNGASWSNVDAPGYGSDASLNAVACAGASACHAVGGDGTALFATRWNGSAWTAVAVNEPAGAQRATLADVTCTSSKNCIAVGAYTTATATKTLTERWNGTKWAIVSSPNPVGARSSSFGGIACPAASTCDAVGTYTAQNYQHRTLVERWNGSSWSIVASPSSSGRPALSSVACRSVSSCTAVGTRGVSTLVERWNGTKWAIVSSPSPSGAHNSVLDAVSCPTATACYAVGSGVFASGGAAKRVFTERWNGSVWKLQASPVAASVSPLNGVGCASSTFCFAAGSYQPLGPPIVRPFLERWNGTAWTAGPAPVPAGATASKLNDVACVSTTFCVAVGDATVGSQRTLVEQWNGSSWTLAPVAVAGSLAGVACADASHCMAVGTSGGQTLVEQWDGSSWTTASGAVSGSLSSVSCGDASHCMAVGLINLPNSPVLQWDGATWTAINGPVPGPFEGEQNEDVTPTGVSCTAPDDCMMVGHLVTAFQFPVPYAGHWDGTSWSEIEMPTEFFGTFPGDVACTSSTDCTAVGIYFPGRSSEQTSVEHWDGTSWSTVTNPNPPAASPPGSFFTSVACTDAGHCFAVGSWIRNANTRTLIEQFA